MLKSKHLPLLLILLFGFILRLYGINWDNGLHLHPDERMIIMVADRIQFFNNLNPEFFNYGSLPIYLLKGIAQLIDIFFSSNVATYQGMLYLGRFLSILFDLGTIFLINKISFLLFSTSSNNNEDNKLRAKSRSLYNNIGLSASLFYAISFFPIQNAHFYTVDTLFTFLSTLLVYALLHYWKRPSSKYLLFMSIAFAALFATKFTAIIFLPIILLVLYLKKGFSSIIYHLGSSILFVFLFMPYAFLDFSKFWADTSTQLAMSKNPYVFPYTLQYVGTTPYIYYLKNIFLWGLGPIISVLSFIGLISFSSVMLNSFQHLIRSRNKIGMTLKCHFLFFIFYILYFLIIGFSAVKFMRYMLPMYPFFTILAGYGLSHVFAIPAKGTSDVPKAGIQSKHIFLLLSLLWTLLFLNIYSQPNTRITATEWILKNIPAGSTLAVEHWDDRLPIYGSEKYYINELQLYNLPDDAFKWSRINEQLQKSNYMIIASNRLYVPLQKLAKYPMTGAYYRRLFKEQLGFKKIAEFSNHPLFIDDQSADESFTVYDHPKIMIFKKTF